MLLALSLFCLVASITPGPNNMMLLSSGATFGFRRTIPHMIGITGGCVVMALIVGWGLGGVARELPRFLPPFISRHRSICCGWLGALRPQRAFRRPRPMRSRSAFSLPQLSSGSIPRPGR